MNALIDFYGNQWLAPSHYLRKNILNLSFRYDDQLLLFGDFFESLSETSLSGRQITGVKYPGAMGKLGGGGTTE